MRPKRRTPWKVIEGNLINTGDEEEKMIVANSPEQAALIVKAMNAYLKLESSERVRER
jgi:hypothetical protein